MQVFTNVSTWSECVKMMSQLSHTVTEPKAVHKLKSEYQEGLILRNAGL